MATFGDGRKTVTTAGTEVQLTTTATRARMVVVQAETDNTGNIAVGVATVVAATGSERGAILDAGQSVSIEAGAGDVIDLSGLYIDATVNGDGVTFFWRG